MKIAIIEPHYDDAWLNMGGHLLLHPEHEYLIVSIAQDQNNPIDLSAKLVRWLPTLRTVALGLHGLPWDEEIAQREMAEQNAQSYTDLFLQRNTLTPNELTDRLEALVEGYDLLALPLGLFHPLHMVVSQLRLRPPTLRYPEYPYAYFASEQQALQRLIQGQTLLTEQISPVVAEKLRLFQEVYASQQFVLTLPECTKPLDDVLVEQFYTREPEAVRCWQRATSR